MKPYFENFTRSLKPSGTILEVGFGPSIQDDKAKSHTIIESDPKHFELAKKWAKQRDNVTLIHDRWENVLPNLGVFDMIFYHAKNAVSKETGHHIVRKGQTLISSVHKQLPELTSIRYSNQDIETFYQQIGHLHLEEMSHFLLELHENQQISDEQYQTFVKKYNLSPLERKIDKHVDPILTFFEACKENHMHKGSSFLCFSSDPTSKYENPQFFEHIITNPHLDYQEQSIPEGLIIMIKKL